MPRLEVGQVREVLRRGSSARVDVPVTPRFKAGDRVRARNIHPAGHTRLPRYARDKVGVIDRDHGVFIYPDAHAHGKGRKPQHCYSVRFSGETLWGPDANANTRLYVDLWDDHLEPA